MKTQTTANGIQYIASLVPYAMYGYELANGTRRIVWDARPNGGRVPVFLKFSNGIHGKLARNGAAARPDKWRELRIGEVEIFMDWTERDYRIEAAQSLMSAEANPETRALTRALLREYDRETAIDEGVDALRELQLPKLQLVTSGILAAIEADPPAVSPDMMDDRAVVTAAAARGSIDTDRETIDRAAVEDLKHMLQTALGPDVNIAVLDLSAAAPPRKPKSEQLKLPDHTRFRDRHGAPITRDAWDALIRREDYCVLARDMVMPAAAPDIPVRVQVATAWIGICPHGEPTDMFRHGFRFVHWCGDLTCPGCGEPAGTQSLHVVARSTTEPDAMRMHAGLRAAMIADVGNVAAKVMRQINTVASETPDDQEPDRGSKRLIDRGIADMVAHFGRAVRV